MTQGKKTTDPQTTEDNFLAKQRQILDTGNMHAWALRTSKYFRDTEPRLAMDIGCGIGMQTYYVHLVNNRYDFIMLDKTGDEPAVSFSEHGYVHNDLELTRGFVWDRVMEAEVHDIDEYKWDKRPGIVFSTLSWGWHYPLKVYLWKVLELQPKYIIVDLREKQEIPQYKIVDDFRINRKETTYVFKRIADVQDEE